MKLNDLVFPVYVLPKDTEIDKQDGIVFANGQMLDDRNIEGETLGIRRLRSSYPTKFILNKATHDIPSFLKSAGKKFIDSSGKVFNYEKTRMVDLKYLLISKIRWNKTESILFVEDINFPFTIPRPPEPEMRYAGILFDRGYPWLLYEYCEFWKKDTKRKI